MGRPSIAVGLALALFVLFSVVSAELAFTVIGDWGMANGNRNAGAIASRSDQSNSQFTVAIGDNFYKNGLNGGKEHGVESVDDAKWQYVFERNYPQPFFQKRWYVIAGNHDYDGNEAAQIEYTKRSDRWYFPSYYYKFTKEVASGVTMDVFMIDTNVLGCKASELKAWGKKRDLKQLKWLAASLKKSKADWKLVMGHHQIYYGKGSNDYMVKKVVPLLEKYKVAAYINGHMHCFEHLQRKKVHYIISGNAALQAGAEVDQKKLKKSGVKAKFVFPTPAKFKSGECGPDGCKGYLIVNMKSAKTMVVENWNMAGKLVYSATITNPKK